MNEEYRSLCTQLAATRYFLKVKKFPSSRETLSLTNSPLRLVSSEIRETYPLPPAGKAVLRSHRCANRALVTRRRLALATIGINSFGGYDESCVLFLICHSPSSRTHPVICIFRDRKRQPQSGSLISCRPIARSVEFIDPSSRHWSGGFA